MGSSRKSWDEKFHSGRDPKVVVLEKAFGGAPAGARMVIASPQAVKEELLKIPSGETMTAAEIRQKLAKRFDADFACPITTGIFLRIVSECALEELAAGKSDSSVAPFWRAVEPQSALASKLTCGSDWISAKRAQEVGRSPQDS